MSDEELSDVREELEAARADVERLQAVAADREARAAHLESQLTEVRQELAQAAEQAEAREQELSALRERSGALTGQVRGAAERYRELVLRQSPELPEELVTGDSVEEIEAALERARETVSKVQGHLESQAQATRVPVGAPVRSAPDLSGLSAEQKIAAGLRQKDR